MPVTEDKLDVLGGHKDIIMLVRLGSGKPDNRDSANPSVAQWDQIKNAARRVTTAGRSWRRRISMSSERCVAFP